LCLIIPRSKEIYIRKMGPLFANGEKPALSSGHLYRHPGYIIKNINAPYNFSRKK
jgi:hypothetical protein